MIRHRGPAPALAIALVLFAAAAQAQAQKTFDVSDAAQLLKAIGPDRTIVLRKGDYKLSSAYSVTSEYVSWAKGDEGRELELSGLKNLTIRGADGARILSDSGNAGILAVYSSSNVTLDNLAFTRTPSAGESASAGSLYAESVDGLSIDRCSFSGGTGLAIDLWECSKVKIRRTSVSDAYSGALSACYATGIDASGLSFSGCEGYPLFYFEDCGEVSVADSKFSANIGGTFVEIYDTEGREGAIVFSKCDFKDNDFEYFSGYMALPQTLSCAFAGNSFGEDWAENAVASGEEEYYGDDWWDSEDYDDEGDWEDYSEYDSYEHDSGLALEYPSYWELKDFAYKSRAGFFSPYGSTSVVILTPYAFPAGAKAPADQAAFASALSALVKSFKDESSLSLSVKPEGVSQKGELFTTQEYRGQTTMGKGESAWARVKLVIYNNKVIALVAVAKEASSLEADTDTDYVFSSISVME